MRDHGISLNAHCPCSQPDCPLRGNCVLCVQAHLDHKRHIPECFENMLREKIDSLVKMVEFDTKDTRPTRSFWETFDKDGLLKECIERHGGEPDGKV